MIFDRSGRYQTLKSAISTNIILINKYNIDSEGSYAWERNYIVRKIRNIKYIQKGWVWSVQVLWNYAMEGEREVEDKLLIWESLTSS